MKNPPVANGDSPLTKGAILSSDEIAELNKRGVRISQSSLPYNKSLNERARELRKSMTACEYKLWHEFLSKQTVRFMRQRVIDNYIVDFYCAKAKLVIEIDGGHHFSKEVEEYDNIRTEVLNAYGLMVLRFTNKDVDHNFDGVCARITNVVPPLLRGDVACDRGDS